MNWYKKAQENNQTKIHPSVPELEAIKKVIPNMEGYWSSSVTKQQLIKTLNNIRGTYEGSENLVPKKSSNTILNLPNGEAMVISPTSSWKGTYKDKMYYIMFFRKRNELV